MYFRLDPRHLQEGKRPDAPCRAQLPPRDLRKWSKHHIYLLLIQSNSLVRQRQIRRNQLEQFTTKASKRHLSNDGQELLEGTEPAQVLIGQGPVHRSMFSGKKSKLVSLFNCTFLQKLCSCPLKMALFKKEYIGGACTWTLQMQPIILLCVAVGASHKTIHLVAWYGNQSDASYVFRFKTFARFL